MRDLMVDIETLGGGSNALILQIGACYFDRLTGQIYNKFCQNISIQDSLDLGFLVDGDTIEFWLKQANRSFLESPLPIGVVLKNFKGFSVSILGADRVWAHATFDFPILVNAYRVLGLGLPFHYKAMRDIRTLVDLSGLTLPKQEPTTKTHDALEDCIHQVGYCTKCFQELDRIWRPPRAS